MRQRVLPLFVVAFAVAITACNSPGSGPLGPSTSLTTGLTVRSMRDQLFIGGSDILTVSSSSGTAKSDVSWGVDAPEIAAIDPATGRLVGISSGRATVWADVRGMRGTKLFRVLPNYAGVWTGTYAVTACHESGDFQTLRFCSSFPAGTTLGMAMTLVQAGDGVTLSTFTLGGIEGEGGAGTVDLDGMLPIAGARTDGSIAVELQNLRLQSTRPGAITGSYEQVWTGGELTGSGRLAVALQSMMRQAELAGSHGRRVRLGRAGSIHDLLVSLRR